MWWSTLTSAVFGLSSSFHPLIGGGGGLVCESVNMVIGFADDSTLLSIVPSSAVSVTVAARVPEP